MSETLRAIKKAHDEYFDLEALERRMWSVKDQGKAFWPDRDGSQALRDLWIAYQKAQATHNQTVVFGRGV